MMPLAFDPTTGQLVFSPATGQLALDCAAASMPCGDCEGHGPVTATITTAGGCGECYGGCESGVYELTWGGWWGNHWRYDGDMGDPWTSIRFWCEGGDTWKIKLVGGCYWGVDGVVATFNAVTFVPEDCVMDNGNGYPTHSGIVIDQGIIGWTAEGDCPSMDCVPTVALS